MLLTLPQETLNDIVTYLHRDEHALQSLSLVDRRLTEECRSHLFSSICIDNPIKLRRWCGAISPGTDGLSKYVRFLDMRGGVWFTPASLQVHLVHLRSFSQLEHLGIRPLDLTQFTTQDLVNCFGPLSTVRSICVRAEGSHWAILNFLALFPLLETTVITSPRPSGIGGNLDFPNLVCRGDLVLKVCRLGDQDNILSCVTRPTTCYRRLGLALVMVHNFAPLRLFFETCGGSLESIQFINLFIPPWVSCPDNLLSSLANLQDIALSVRFLNDHLSVFTILSSITSVKLESVTFIVWECYYPDDLDNFCLRWMKIENAMCRLSELKKGSESGGEVVLNIHFDDERLANKVTGYVERKEFMPRFQEGGRVNVEAQRMDLNRAMSNIVPEEFR